MGHSRDAVAVLPDPWPPESQCWKVISIALTDIDIRRLHHYCDSLGGRWAWQEFFDRNPATLQWFPWHRPDDASSRLANIFAGDARVQPLFDDIRREIGLEGFIVAVRYGLRRGYQFPLILDVDALGKVWP